jgi:hypothetical protein
VRFTPTLTPSSVFVRELDGRGRSIAPQRIWAVTLPQHPLTRLRTPPNRHLPPSDPQAAPLGQVLALGNQTLIDGAGQHRDALVPDLVAEVLAGEADSARAGRTQDIRIQVVPILSGHHRASSGHRKQVSTPVLLVVVGVGQGRTFTKGGRMLATGPPPQRWANEESAVRGTPSPPLSEHSASPNPFALGEDRGNS